MLDAEDTEATMETLRHPGSDRVIDGPGHYLEDRKLA
jgi:hypothetical protein